MAGKHPAILFLCIYQVDLRLYPDRHDQSVMVLQKDIRRKDYANRGTESRIPASW